MTPGLGVLRDRTLRTVGCSARRVGNLSSLLSIVDNTHLSGWSRAPPDPGRPCPEVRRR